MIPPPTTLHIPSTLVCGIMQWGVLRVSLLTQHNPCAAISHRPVVSPETPAGGVCLRVIKMVIGKLLFSLHLILVSGRCLDWSISALHSATRQPKRTTAHWLPGCGNSRKFSLYLVAPSYGTSTTVGWRVCLTPSLPHYNMLAAWLVISPGRRFVLNVTPVVPQPQYLERYTAQTTKVPPALN